MLLCVQVVPQMTHYSLSNRKSHPLTPILRIHILTGKMQNSQERCSIVLRLLSPGVLPLSFARAIILHNIKSNSPVAPGSSVKILLSLT